MSKPIPAPIEPAKLVELALAVVRDDRFPFMREWAMEYHEVPLP